MKYKVVTVKCVGTTDVYKNAEAYFHDSSLVVETDKARTAYASGRWITCKQEGKIDA